MFPTEFTEQELNNWLNTLDTHTSIAIMEKLYKDFRDYSLGVIEKYEVESKEVRQ